MGFESSKVVLDSKPNIEVGHVMAAGDGKI